MTTAQDNILLRLENIEKGFGGTEVLRGISLSVARGEFITLLGSSGCGKTTTLRIIAGLEIPDGGRVYLDGQDVTDWEPNKRDVNTVFQSYALFPHMSVAQNVAYSLKLKRVPAAEAKRQVAEALELVQLTGFEDRMPGELSGGQRQRVAIARAVVSRPKVLLLDEPLGALDLQLRRQMQHELKQLQQKLGITFIYITHDQEEALTMSDRIAVMRDGGFEQIGTAAEVYDRPKTAFVARFVGSANVIPDGAGGWVAVRGEHVELVPENEAENASPDNASAAADAAHSGLAAVVVQKSFAGGMLRVSVRSDDGTEIIATRHGIDWPLEPGQRVHARWQAQHAVPVEGGDEAHSATAPVPANGDAAHSREGEVEAD